MKALPGGDLRNSVPGWARSKADDFHRRSRDVVTFLSLRMELVGIIWMAVATAVALPKVAAATMPSLQPAEVLRVAAPYILIIAAPVLGYWAATGSFPSRMLGTQPRFRLAFYGRWKAVSVLEAQSDPRFGPTGFMASLLIGLMLNVPIRLIEFAAAVPAMNSHAPAWGQTLFLAMGMEVAVMSFLYMACFVLALRSIPFFPRMLAFVWVADIAAQLAIANVVSRSSPLPAEVAIALQDLLNGNIKKTLVSISVWLPYLLLSHRVNITYRRRVRAG